VTSDARSTRTQRSIEVSRSLPRDVERFTVTLVLWKLRLHQSRASGANSSPVLRRVLAN
jgi:hypothetical protein